MEGRSGVRSGSARFFRLKQDLKFCSVVTLSQITIRSVVVVSKIVVYIQDGLDLVIPRRRGAECSRIRQLIWIKVYGRLRCQAVDLFRRHPYRVSIRPEAGSKFVRQEPADWTSSRSGGRKVPHPLTREQPQP